MTYQTDPFMLDMDELENAPQDLEQIIGDLFHEDGHHTMPFDEGGVFDALGMDFYGEDR